VASNGVAVAKGNGVGQEQNVLLQVALAAGQTPGEWLYTTGMQYAILLIKRGPKRNRNRGWSGAEISLRDSERPPLAPTYKPGGGGWRIGGGSATQCRDTTPQRHAETRQWNV
jgi:hypothetical protein